MALAAGTRLGPYEVLGLVGAGGMGEVYRARDTRLDRSVAIKVLPAELAADPDRRARFEREARAIAALSHPHICTLHDIGEAVPAPCPMPLVPVHYLVMEYLDGVTLAEHLARVAARTPHSGPPSPPGSGQSATPTPGRMRHGAPLPLDETLRIGTELAEALAAAHKAGIIHRDLKPGNVMLTSSGAKVLDFGLARLHVAEAAPGASSLATRAAEPLTDAGTRLGTVPYMAPEQVEGKEADARSDVFALGAILYEMATGHRAFEGETAASVAAAILDREPEPVTAVQPLTPPAFEHVVTTCLAKDPEARWQAASDVAREIRWVADERRLARTPTGGLPPGAATSAALAAGRRRRWFIVAAFTTSIAVVAAGVAWLLRSPAPQVSLAHVSLDVRPAEELNAGGVTPAWLPTPGGSRTALTWTPDGQAQVFVGRRGGVQQLYVRRLDAAEAIPLAGTEGAQVPAVSLGGQWVAFWAEGAIRKVPLGGGPAMDLASEIAAPPYGLVWDRRGRLFFGGGDGRIWTIPLEGNPVPVTTLGKAEVRHSLPWPLPGEQVVLYSVRKRQVSWGDEEVVAQTLATGQRRVLLKDATDARYLSIGYLVFLRRGVLFAVPFDAERVQVSGKEGPVLDGVAQALTARSAADATGAGHFAVAATGTLAWVPGSVVPYPDATLVTLDRRGQVAPLPAPVRSYAGLMQVSPDGRRLAVTVQTLTEEALWIYDLDRETLLPLARNGEVLWAAWMPDGRHLVFDWLSNGRRSLATQPADGAVPPRELLAGHYHPASVTPDGQHLVALREDKDIVSVALERGRGGSVQAVVEASATSAVGQWPEISPDGRWLAYVSSVSGQPEVYIRPYPGPGAPTPVSLSGGQSPAWRPAGGELFFVACEAGSRCQLRAAQFAPGSPPRIARPRLLFEFAGGDLPFAFGQVRCYDVAPDGQRFYTVQWRTPPPAPVVTHVNLVLNWFEELKARVPAKGTAK